MSLRVIETYASYQGEGPNTSRPTLFVRFAGCNFKCSGWPCDTQHAIDPNIFRGLQKFWDPIELADHCLSFEVKNICLTGGEVFLQPKADLTRFLNAIKQTDSRINIECFTNGALEWGPDLPALIDTFVVDWKLPGSGESVGDSSIFRNNIERLGEEDAIKFTIKDRDDYAKAKERYNTSDFFDNKDAVPIYAGVVWGQELTTEKLCEWMLADCLNWNLNVQVHKFVWHPDKIGV